MELQEQEVQNHTGNLFRKYKVVSELFQKSTFVNLCKALKSIFIIPVSSDHLTPETVQRKEKI